MISSFRFFGRLQFAAGWLVWFVLCALGGPVCAQNVVLHLKSGDQLTGFLVSENTNQVVLSNAWIKLLPVPLAEISRRETLPGGQPAKAVGTPRLAEARPSAAKPAAAKGQWHGQANVGLDALFSTKSQQDYFGKIKLTYSKAYASNPKDFFRNTSQVSGEYQRTDGQISANRVNGNNKSDFDIGERSYGYCSLGAGYDEIRMIALQYQAGPGMGVHVIRRDNFALDVEDGLEYEAEYRRNTSDLESLYLRVAEDVTWKIRKRLTLTEKLELYSDLESVSQYRGVFTSTLSYGFWENLTLNLTADDSYTTEVAPDVQRNEFEVRFTLGVVF